MTPLTVVVGLNPEGQIALQRIGIDQLLTVSSRVSSSLRVEKKFSTTALSQQQALADMLQLIRCFLRSSL
jgi:hypothetical protein